MYRYRRLVIVCKNNDTRASTSLFHSKWLDSISMAYSMLSQCHPSTILPEDYCEGAAGLHWPSDTTLQSCVKTINRTSQMLSEFKTSRSGRSSFSFTEENDKSVETLLELDWPRSRVQKTSNYRKTTVKPHTIDNTFKLMSPLRKGLLQVVASYFGALKRRFCSSRTVAPGEAGVMRTRSIPLSDLFQISDCHQ